MSMRDRGLYLGVNEGLQNQLQDPVRDLVHLPLGIQALLPRTLLRHLGPISVALPKEILDSEIK